MKAPPAVTDSTFSANGSAAGAWIECKVGSAGATGCGGGVAGSVKAEKRLAKVACSSAAPWSWALAVSEADKAADNTAISTAVLRAAT